VSTEPNLAEIIREALDARMNDLHVAMPAKVVSYDEATQTVEVQPMIRRAMLDTDGQPTHEELPNIPNVPVAFPRSAAFQMTWPLAKGDPVLLVFNSSAIGQWRETGDLADPVDLRRHDLSYPVAFPNVGPNGDVAPTASDAVVMTPVAPATHVRVGGVSAQFVALESLVNARFKELADAILNAAVAPNDGGAALQTAAKLALTSSGWSGTLAPPTMAATKLKSE